MSTHHPRPIGHISLGVRDYDASKAFYTAALAPLGLRLVYDSESPAEATPAPPAESPEGGHRRRTLGFGPDEEHEMINVFEYGDKAHAPGQGSHIAFNAPTRAAVEQFHDAAVRCGGKSNGEPGLRSKYGPRYFASFVIDPDGWMLEAVCKEEGSE
ncbi:hypothetical protein NKR23_g12034 [Pleurostoma richardsiae]|uniref:VOC domain-containing protein n=1 Tax=Pleurostoma richardsiae TaxID=41990 RepID=A0AA38VG31_9PEZI|nr:hypothetical protein NKR23_g12034 [Pleurostoma richardsiae]